MKKFKLFINIDKEETFLNEMAIKGYHLREVKEYGQYIFEEKSLEEVNYKIDFRPKMEQADYEDYLQLFEDFGWTLVSGNKDSKRQYFKPSHQDCDQSMFSTKESALERYKHMRTTYASTSITLMILYAAVYKDSQLSDAWFNPEIFNLEGMAFFKSFALELPLVLLKLIPALVLPLLVLWYTFLLFKSRSMYKNIIK